MAVVRGLNNVLANLNKEIAKIKAGTKAGMMEAALVVKADSVKMTPVDTSNLRGSAYARAITENDKIVGIVGYTAAYALWVHEMPMKLKGLPRIKNRGKYWDPQGIASNKFLEKSLLKNRDRIISILQKYARIK